MKRLMTLIVLFMVLFLISCGPPQAEVEADSVLVGFEDGSVVTLEKGTTGFEEIAEEAIRVYQHVGLSTECYFGTGEIEAIKRDNKSVEIKFDDIVEIPTSVRVNDLEEEIRDKHGRKTTEDGFIIGELKSALFPLTGELKGHVLYRPEERYRKGNDYPDLSADLGPGDDSSKGCPPGGFNGCEGKKSPHR